MTGYYRNSVRRDSFYAAHESQWAVADDFRVGLIAGAVTGYRYSVIPFVLPEAIARVGSLELALTYAPCAWPGTGAGGRAGPLDLGLTSKQHT